MEILIISGLSGSGKSRAAAFLEDAGYYTVDNLPAEMMLRFADFCAAAGGRYDKLAFVYDVRAGEPSANLTDAVASSAPGASAAACCFWRPIPPPSSAAIRRPAAAILSVPMAAP